VLVTVLFDSPVNLQDEAAGSLFTALRRIVQDSLETQEGMPD
jgi:hypothetical protein